ncbi:MAG: hypothetical protein OXF49_00210 [Candidatus Saccharibacteria bacterium]|nr:hypothetical protein [Candidatus Saccharibacteria bacterium]MCY4088553.1 hypothetical protein [Candidatus Saccharibacteria bacterium]
MAQVVTDKFTDRNASDIARKLVNLLRRRFKRFGNQGQALSIFPIVGRGDDSLDSSYRLASPYDNFKDYHHGLNARQDEDGLLYVRTRPNRFERKGIILPDLIGREKPGSPQAIYGKEELTRLTAEVLVRLALILDHRPGLILPGERPSIIKPDSAGSLLLSRLQGVRQSEDSDNSDLQTSLKVLDKTSRRLEFAIIVSDFLSIGWEEWLTKISRQIEVIAFQITDPWDIELPEFGQRFNHQDQIIRINTRNPKVRQAYRNLTAKQQDHIKTVLEQNQIRHYRLATTNPLFKQLERSL